MGGYGVSGTSLTDVRKAPLCKIYQVPSPSGKDKRVLSTMLPEQVSL